MEQTTGKDNGYFLYFLAAGTKGVEKKIDAQIKAFEREFSMTRICVQLKNSGITHKIIRRLPFGNIGYHYEKAKEIIKNPAFIYIRRSYVDRGYINFLREIKETYPSCKIIVEIFTYPYDKDEFNRNIKHFFSMLPFYVKELFYRKRFYKYVDRFVTYSNDDVIFRVPTIKTINGVDISSIERINNPNPSLGEVIHFISVARMQVHHGYERFIKGIANYYKNGGTRKILYHVVGDGNELPYYQELALRLGVNECVVFHGAKTGAALDELFHLSDVGIASLGLYKYNINLISPLKVGEYFARGLPVITGCRLSINTDAVNEYLFECPNNAEPLSVEKIIRFTECLYSKHTRTDMINYIRAYAEQTCDMTVTIQPIINFIKGNVD